MIWLIYILNIFLWGIASIVLAVGIGSNLFGFLYFIIGYPLSLFILKFSDNYAVSYLDTLQHPPFTIWRRKLIWSNGIASAIIWAVILLLAFILKLNE
jgi:hypothetical protein